VPTPAELGRKSGWTRDELREPTDARVISICDWCQLPQGRIFTDEDLVVAIEEARRGEHPLALEASGRAPLEPQLWLVGH
jgi:hypothetical protein